MHPGTGRPPDITALTGLRSSKPSWYAEYRQTAGDLHRALDSLEHVAGVLSATGQGAGALCRAVVDATAEQLGEPWVVLALAPAALPLARPRLLGRGPAGAPVGEVALLPEVVRRPVQAALAADAVEPWQDADGAVVVPLVVDGEPVGALVACGGPRRTVGPADLSILRIVANQSAVALLSDHLLARSESLRRQTERLYAQAEERARALAEQHRQLAEAQRRLDVAAQREAVDAERHRIARELHDSVAQHVLSAGMTIEWCRPEVAHHAEVHERLGHAKALTREAVERLRGAIHALSSDGHGEDGEGLPALVGRLPVLVPAPGPALAVRVEGVPRELPGTVERALFRIASECLFNTVRHAGASRCTVRLAYRATEVRLSVADDGGGDPELLRRALRASGRRADGYHRGLGNMASRCREIGATLRFTRARMGGVRVEVRLPLGDDDG
ncbi:GAF domain-containing sensor histidine kinase [Geodermatophilus marinus]|uniref:GAF domain-containing sensor histidine kinase n=1 Tax=Geodermatophilus sp. LHW52908 TaxID=2303986 RepID=UPI000E3B9E24|nr:GAF domain-containing sensor histidine kinase [Geodermatophilus sp. LHW52908]RFU20116.1 GAF domain-containing protein [Geodermatophilus sp. LHW52908]